MVDGLNDWLGVMTVYQDIFKAILSEHDEKFNTMLKDPIQYIQEAISYFLDELNFRILCINYHNQVKVEREIHVKLIKSTLMV